ncbi:alpha/beta fold hydrolase [Shewanella sp. NIFS-20-20]|uniref:alpha/beta fold hydrolase n=1 Tax=Shewanella sp. NIFS-20-20 TaxID=2853806 RepID=UPI001C450E15|nr:alpha/beta fold hydrolase [Shewanella sp. NIFS-20-20]MBV7317429.1 alpha/beta fold hydrolase [Shewanella sp. NIFS-20-20]
MAWFIIMGGGLIWLWYAANRHPDKTLHVARNMYAYWAGVERLFVSIDDLKHQAYWRISDSQHYASAAPWVVMIHGFSADKTVWSLFAHHLPKHYSLLMVDLTGHGESEYNDQCRFDIASQAQRLCQMLDALGIEQCHLVGNSMGGQIAAYIASHHAERCLTTYLFNPSGIVAPQTNPFVQAIMAGDNPFFTETRAQFDHFYQQTMARPPWLPQPLLKAIYLQRRQSNLLLERIFCEFTQEPVPPSISGDVRICWGQVDQILDISALALWQQCLPHADILVYPNIGHMPMLECPKQAAADFCHFIENRHKKTAP